MSNIELLSNALEYIENHLDLEITTQDVAKHCYCSKSTLEKLFRCINGITLHDYLIRRRMMKAARLIHEYPDKSILDIALQYGYGSNEAFTRAFKQVWNCNPSELRRQPRCWELFPRLLCPLETGDDYMDKRRHIDISELYDLFTERKNCYFICCDIKNLVGINNISRKAGDLAILESMRRMNAAAGPDDIVFRIGGDEFAVLTDTKDMSAAEEIASRIESSNNQPIHFEAQEIPLSLHISIVKPDNVPIKYNELFTKLHTAIKDNKLP